MFQFESGRLNSSLNSFRNTARAPQMFTIIMNLIEKFVHVNCMFIISEVSTVVSNGRVQPAHGFF